MRGRLIVPILLAALFAATPLWGAGAPGVALVGGAADLALCDLGMPTAGGCVKWAHTWPSEVEESMAVETVAWDEPRGRTFVLGRGVHPDGVGGDLRAYGFDGAYLWGRDMVDDCVIRDTPCRADDKDPRNLAVTADGSTVVAVGIMGDGTWGTDHAVVVAYDTATGEAAWSDWDGIWPFGVVGPSVAIDEARGIVVVTGRADDYPAWTYELEWTRAYDLATGEVLWTRTLDIDIDPEFTWDAWDATLAIDEATGVVYAHGQFVTARDIVTGDLLWHRVLPDAAGRASHGAAVALDEATGILVAVTIEGITHHGFVHGVDPATGSVLWSTDTMDSVPEALVTDGAGRAYVVEQGRVAAVDVASGDLAWVTSHQFLGGPRHTLEVVGWDAAVAADEGLLFVGTNQGVSAMDTATGDLLWENRVRPVYGVMVAEDGETLYGLGIGNDAVRLHGIDPGVGVVSGAVRGVP